MSQDSKPTQESQNYMIYLCDSRFTRTWENITVVLQRRHGEFGQWVITVDRSTTTVTKLGETSERKKE